MIRTQRLILSSMRVLPTLQTSTGTASRHGPVRHRCHVQASSTGYGAPLCPGGRHGESTCLLVFVRGLGRTVLVRSPLFLT